LNGTAAVDPEAFLVVLGLKREDQLHRTGTRIKKESGMLTVLSNVEKYIYESNVPLIVTMAHLFY
jgi:hypothetical protein